MDTISSSLFLRQFYFLNIFCRLKVQLHAPRKHRVFSHFLVQSTKPAICYDRILWESRVSLIKYPVFPARFGVILIKVSVIIICTWFAEFPEPNVHAFRISVSRACKNERLFVHHTRAALKPAAAKGEARGTFVRVVSWHETGTFSMRLQVGIAQFSNRCSLSFPLSLSLLRKSQSELFNGHGQDLGYGNCSK